MGDPGPTRVSSSFSSAVSMRPLRASVVLFHHRHRGLSTAPYNARGRGQTPGVLQHDRTLPCRLALINGALSRVRRTGEWACGAGGYPVGFIYLESGYCPGVSVRADLTVTEDGPGGQWPDEPAVQRGPHDS